MLQMKWEGKLSLERAQRGPTKQQGGRCPTPGPPESEIRATAEDSLQVCEGAYPTDSSLLRALENVFESWGRNTFSPRLTLALA